jgi:voltage-gated potassium channel
MHRRKIAQIPIIIILILSCGTIGYKIFEPEYSYFDSLYMTVITITTIGYTEVITLSTAGRIFNLFLIGFGWLGIFLVARMLGQMVVEGQILKILGRHRMDKKLASLSNHYIVCGFGRVGKVVCEEFYRNKVPFAVIERNPELIDDLINKGLVYHQGDCTSDESLIASGIKKAKGLINAVADEADAVYITLSARSQNPDLFIMARADSPSAEHKLKRAGADRVISPHISAGFRMAMSATRPNVVDFMSIKPSGDGEGLRIDEVVVSKGSKLVGQSFKGMDVRARYGINVIGLKKTDGRMLYNPSPDHIIESEDTLFLVGDADHLAKIDDICSPVE